MARNKKSKRPNLPQETLERARAEMRGEIYIPDAGDFEDDEPVVQASTRTRTASASTLSAVPPAPAIPSRDAVTRTKTERAATKPVNSPIGTARVKRGVTTARRIPTISELLGEYQYVLRDLRNLGILAISLLVAILVLAVIITHV